jgi:hypothetical protein
MSVTWQEAEYEQGMERLYEEFKKQYEDEVIFDKIQMFYKNNPEIVKEPYQNLNESNKLFADKYYTASFLHSIIAMEVVIKTLVFKPILYSLSFDKRASDLLYDVTLKNKSIKYIPKEYYDILKDLTKKDFKEIKRKNSKIKLWDEIINLQNLRNEIIHQGKIIEKDDAERALNITVYIFDEVIQKILSTFHYYIKDDKVCYGYLDKIKII